MSTTLYKALLRPLLFTLPPEEAQKLADFTLARSTLWKALAPTFRIRGDRLRSNVAGITVPNPVGLAAGYDKDCRFLPSLLNLGFGYVVGGTVTLNPRPGNPKPRVVRKVRDKALLNSLGFPGKGLEHAARQLEKCAGEKERILVSVAGLTVEEYVQCHRRLEPLVSGIELNISSPNTQGIKMFQEPENFRRLLDEVNKARKKPLFVKLPPYSNPQDKDRTLALARICVEKGVEGVIATNTMPTEDKRLKVGRGGLSGKPIFQQMLAAVSDIRSECGPKLTINACGGIFTSDDAWRALEAGSDSVQILTGLVYEGPRVAKAINKGLLRNLEEKNLTSLQEFLNKRSSDAIA